MLVNAETAAAFGPEPATLRSPVAASGKRKDVDWSSLLHEFRRGSFVPSIVSRSGNPSLLVEDSSFKVSSDGSMGGSFSSTAPLWKGAMCVSTMIESSLEGLEKHLEWVKVLTDGERLARCSLWGCSSTNSNPCCLVLRGAGLFAGFLNRENPGCQDSCFSGIT
jgi:hypothetical protein